MTYSYKKHNKFVFFFDKKLDGLAGTVWLVWSASFNLTQDREPVERQALRFHSV